MKRTGVTTNINDVIRHFGRLPKVFVDRMELALKAGAIIISNYARQDAPKAYSLLTQSIYDYRIGHLTWGVGPHVGYALEVEKGSRPGGYPPLSAIADWVRIKRIQPNDPTYTTRDLAWVIRRKIAERGIAPQPFMAPASEKGNDQAISLIQRAWVIALREAGFA